jgi:hypothetical protein
VRNGHRRGRAPPSRSPMRAPRAAGQTKWNYWRLWNLSIEASPASRSTRVRLLFRLGDRCPGSGLSGVLHPAQDHSQQSSPWLSFITCCRTLSWRYTGHILAYIGRIFNETRDVHFTWSRSTTERSATSPCRPGLNLREQRLRRIAAVTTRRLSSSASLWRAPTLLTELVTTNDATRVL